ncbi:CCR4-NOT core subunit cdc39 [Thecaphora frezii]
MSLSPFVLGPDLCNRNSINSRSRSRFHVPVASRSGRFRPVGKIQRNEDLAASRTRVRSTTSPPPLSEDDAATLDIVKGQVCFLVATLSEQNLESYLEEAERLCDRFEHELYSHLIQQLAGVVLLQGPEKDSDGDGDDLDDSDADKDGRNLRRLQLSFFGRQLFAAAENPALAQRFVQALDRVEPRSQAFSSVRLGRLLLGSGLEPQQKLVVASALASASIRPELAAQAVRMVNGAVPPSPGIGENAAASAAAAAAAAAASSSSSVLDSALDALRQGGPNGTLGSDQLASFLGSLLSDAVPPNSPLLQPAHRQRLLAAVSERIGPDATAQVLRQTLPNLRMKLGKNLTEFLIDLGPSGLPNAEVVRSILERFDVRSADDRTTSELLASLLSVDTDLLNGGDVTNYGNLVRGWSLANPHVSWARVVRGLDEPEGFEIPPSSRMGGIAAILIAAPRQQGQPPAVSGLWGAWTHKQRQLRILNGLVSQSPDTFSFASLPGRRIVTADDVAGASATVKSLAASVQGSTWNSLDLVETLTQIAGSDEPGVRAAVTELFEKAVKSSAELVLMGLVQIRQPWNRVHSELASKLLAMFLSGHPSHQLVFYRLWKTNQEYTLSSLHAFYDESPINIARLVDVVQEIKALDTLLDQRPFAFALDVAALASRREYLNLEIWLQSKVAEHGSEFVRASLEFLDNKAKDDLAKQDPQAEQNFMPLTVQTVATFLKVLRSNGDNMSPEEIDYFKVVRNLCLQLHPRLMNLAPGAEGQEPGLHVVTFSQDIHEEADSWYRQMYEEKISIDDVIALLQRTKISDDPRDHQVFACMVHTLFDEYRWFEMYYPPRELAMTAVVFGSLIQHQLIDYIPLGIAIRYVLDALRNPPDSNMFKFGLQALLRFQNRLPEWPQLCQALLSMPHLQQSHPEIVRLVRMAMAGGGGQDGAAAASAAGGDTQQRQGAPDEEKPAFTAIHVDSVPETVEQREPEEEVSDKVLFIVNNLSPSNLEAKLNDAKRLIKPEIFRWFSSYLVLQRVSIEPNNHGLYAQFLDGLDGQTLLSFILHETLDKVRMLLNSEKTVQSTQERTLLKNLGSWLGSLTLARNKPIRHRNIAFKELLVQGYDNNRLIVAIPFVCKVLEQCARSEVFVPPNPWLMAVLRLMVELYQFAELKLNLKFEIEVLCKSLNVELKDIQPTTILRNRPTAEILQQQQLLQQQQQQLGVSHQHQQQRQQQQHLVQQPATGLAQDLERLSVSGGFAGAAAGRGLVQVGPKASAAAAAVAAAGSGTQPGQSAAAAAAYTESLVSMLQSLGNYIVINPQLTLFANNATLKRMIHIAIDRAVREIIAPVVERSVTIASISTRELVMKDFAMEGDENRMGKAAHQMAQNLAGSLALVTCKEPLRISMVTHARSLFLQSGFTEQTLPEQALLVIMQDNLDLACSVIERAAMDKAVPEVDDGLANAYSSRRDHRTRGRGYYWDSAALAASQYAATLPDLLRLRPEGLQPAQLRVYDDFARFSRMSPGPASVDGDRGTPASAHASALSGRSDAGYGESAAAAAGSSADKAGLATAATGLAQPIGPMTGQQSLERFSHHLGELECHLSKMSENETLATLPQDHDIRTIVRQIPMTAAQSLIRDETALAFSQKVVQLLYKSDSRLGREIYVILLERLCEVSIKAAREVTAWLVYAEDERKFNVPVSVCLIRAGLINIAELDIQLAKLIMRDFRASVIDFAANLALQCLREPACATRQQLANTIEALHRAVQRGKATNAAAEFLEELEGGQLKAKIDIGNTALREQLAYCFAEWVRLFQQSPNSEKSFIDFVTQLQTQGILKGEEISSMFFRVCTEVSVDSYIKQKAVGGSMASGIFCPIDAFSKLVVLMIKYHADPTGTNNEQAKVHYLTKILSIVVLVLAQSHEELGPHFQQKPFFRLFSSLLHDLHLTESNLGNAYVQTLLAISNTLNTLQPSFFPGFTFSWMSLVSHRLFMPKLLLANGREGWSAFHRLFASLLRFMAPFLRKAQLQETSRQLYKGTLRILLVLLHDFPEFLCDYHQSFCDIVPPSCIQLRNLILSAFPRNRRLPDPFTPNLKIDLLPEISQHPTIASDHTAAFGQVPGFKQALDRYLQSHEPRNFATTLKEVLLSSNAQETDPSKGESRYNLPLINALVLYSAVRSIEGGRNVLTGHVQDDACIAIMEQLTTELDPEGRFMLLTAAANQLRFPSSHTAYFSSLLIHLFATTGQEAVREQITRVLLERLIVNRPHPWGLLTTFIELMRSHRHLLPKAPGEIQALLDHIASTLVGGVDDSGANSAVQINGLASGVSFPQHLQQQA